MIDCKKNSDMVFDGQANLVGALMGRVSVILGSDNNWHDVSG